MSESATVPPGKRRKLPPVTRDELVGALYRAIANWVLETSTQPSTHELDNLDMRIQHLIGIAEDRVGPKPPYEN